MERLISQFLDYLQYERNRSQCTVGSYGGDLRAFAQYVGGLDDELSWDTIDQDVVRGWVESMVDAGNVATTVNRRLSALRTFYRFAMARGLCDSDPSHLVKGLKKDRLLPQYLREEEIDRLLDEDIWSDAYDDVLARTIILVFYSTGIRLAELVSLNDTSFDFASGNLKVLGKRDKERLIPFGKELSEAVRTYQRRRDAKFGASDGAFFLDKKGKRIRPDTVRQIVARWLPMVTSIKKRSPHVLRHTFATAMLNNDSGLENVQKLLGHASIATTEIYTHTTFEQLKRAYENAHPREKD